MKIYDAEIILLDSFEYLCIFEPEMLKSFLEKVIRSVLKPKVVILPYSDEVLNTLSELESRKMFSRESCLFFPNKLTDIDIRAFLESLGLKHYLYDVLNNIKNPNYTKILWYIILKREEKRIDHNS